MPAALTLILICPSPGSRSGTPAHFSTSGGPYAVITIALGIAVPFNLDRRPGSCLMVDGHWRSWPDFLAKSLVCFEYSRRLWRSHPLSGGLSLPLLLPFLLPAVPQRRRAPLPAAVSRRAAR